MKELFDFDFNSFITPKIVKIVYILIMVGLGIAYLAMVIATFAARQASLALLILFVLGPLAVLIYLALARMGLESLIASIRTAQNTGELVRLANGGSQGGPQQGGPQHGGPSPLVPENPYGNTPPA